MLSYRWLSLCCVIVAICTIARNQPTLASQKESSLKSLASRDQRRLATLAEEVRHELVTLPYYSVFDWLEGSVNANGDVTLAGEVVRPTTKSDAEARLKNRESVSRVVNKIVVLPLSPSDDRLRVALYRAIFNFNSPLFRYGTAPVPSIHIIVSNGHVRLKGVVASPQDGQLAYIATNGVFGVFDVKNELLVEKSQKRK